MVWCFYQQTRDFATLNWVYINPRVAALERSCKSSVRTESHPHMGVEKDTSILYFCFVIRAAYGLESQHVCV